MTAREKIIELDKNKEILLWIARIRDISLMEKAGADSLEKQKVLVLKKKYNGKELIVA